MKLLFPDEWFPSKNTNGNEVIWSLYLSRGPNLYYLNNKRKNIKMLLKLKFYKYKLPIKRLFSGPNVFAIILSVVEIISDWEIGSTYLPIYMKYKFYYYNIKKNVYFTFCSNILWNIYIW